MSDSPWLSIPAADYEAHMEAVGQAAPLRAIFADVYAARRPRRLAILGCTTGRDLLAIDPAVTEHVVGVDVNPAYAEAARRNGAALGARLRVVVGNVSRVELAPASFDLVCAALLLEYVEPLAFFKRARGWLAPGGALSVVTQEPRAGVGAVSATPFESLRALAPVMSLRAADEVAAVAAHVGLRRVSRRDVAVANGKILVVSLFES